MKILMVITNPYSSLSVLAQAGTYTVERQGMSVYWLYTNMFEEMAANHLNYLYSFDIIHFIAGVECFSFDLVSRTAEYCSVVSTYHHRQFSEVPRQFDLVEKMFYVSRSLEPDIHTFGLPTERSLLLHNGVDTSLFKPSSRIKRENTFQIGFFGARPSDDSGDRKGTDILLDTVRKLISYNLFPKFIIVGHGWNDLVLGLRNLGLAVKYLVNVEREELPNIYNQLDLYLITSRLEGGPLTLLEAGACKVPIISTPVGLALEVLSQPGCGKLLSGFDSHEIAQAVMEDMRNPAAARVRAEAVYAEIDQNWDWQQTYRDLPKVYKEIVRKKKSQFAKRPQKRFPEPYFDFSQAPIKQRNMARSYAMIDFAWKLYYQGDRVRAFQMVLPLIGRIKFDFFWNKFLKNVIASSPLNTLLSQYVHRK